MAENPTERQWQKSIGLRKSRAGCAGWLFRSRCGKGAHAPGLCLPPRADHVSTWTGKLGLRILCSQPYSEDTESQAAEIEAWAKASSLAVYVRPDLSWHYPGWTTLHIVAFADDLAQAAQASACAGCDGYGKIWKRRRCCPIGEMIEWWEGHLVSDAVMGI